MTDDVEQIEQIIADIEYHEAATSAMIAAEANRRAHRPRRKLTRKQAWARTEQLRENLEVVEPTYGLVPTWLRARMQQKLGMSDPYEVIGPQSTLHWGSLDTGGTELAFVLEPESHCIDLGLWIRVYGIAERLGCKCTVTAASYWRPPHTIRILIESK